MDDYVNSYRACFSTDAGKRVLADILLEGGYFDADIRTEGEIAVQNFVKDIVNKLGVGNKPEDSGDYVKKLFEISAGEYRWRKKKPRRKEIL